MPYSSSKLSNQLLRHQQLLSQCQLCPDMQGPPVFGQVNVSKILLVGQAPGFKEIEVHKPFAWTAGKTLFGWFQQIGIEEEQFRKNVYMSAMCRCFPGKFKNGVRLKTGDRVPTKQELKNCNQWLDTEIKLLAPDLIIPVGKLAITHFVEFKKLTEVIGKQHTVRLHDKNISVIPLPHPSGASTWPRTEPGKGLLQKALKLIASHNSCSKVF